MRRRQHGAQIQCSFKDVTQLGFLRQYMIIIRSRVYGHHLKWSPVKKNAAESLQYVPPLIQFPSKKKVYARLWRVPFHGLVGQSKLLSALLEESRQSQFKHRSAYIYTRLCSLVSGFLQQGQPQNRIKTI